MLLFVGTMFACSGGEDDTAASDFGAEVESIVGRYALTRWEEAACGEDSGKNVLESHTSRFLELRTYTYFGVTELLAWGCNDAGHCTDVADDGMAKPFSEVSFSFTEGTLSEGIVGVLEWATTDSDGSCSGALETDSLTVDSAGSIEIRAETTVDVPFEPDADDEGSCWTDDAAEAAEGAECGTVVIVTADPA